MIKKLKLDLSNDYQRKVASLEVAKMLEQFVKGESHPLQIGAEQGDIPSWDDIIIEIEEGKFRHLQVKRVSSGKFERKDGVSTFDNSIKELGKWVKANPSGISSREFVFCLESGEIEIETGFTVSQFESFIQLYIKEHTASADKLK